jgi:disulfide bond formation protein DsbB
MTLAALERLTPRVQLVGVAAGALAAVGAALYGQHVQGMQPCPWCILQRLIFLLIAALALLTAALPAGWRLKLPLGGLAIALAGLCGVAAALYQNLVAAHLPSCDLTLADRIVSGLGADAMFPELFEVRSSCADAAVKLFGVPYELLSCTLFVLIATAAVWLMLTNKRPQR